MDTRPRFGLIGTGVWARGVGMPAAARSEAVQFTGILSRNAETVTALAAAHGVIGHTDLAAFLSDVDIVGIAVPPYIQPTYARAAVAAGKHLLLEKPVAINPVEADAIVSALDARGLASLVLFTQLMMPRQRLWIDETTAVGGWIGARIDTFSRLLVDPANPYHATAAWRGDGGALWDAGPHAVALLTTILGDVTDVTATRGAGDLVVVTLRHRSGAVSTITLAMDAPGPLPGETAFFGSAGKRILPPSADWNAEATEAYGLALATLAAVATGRPTPPFPDARFGAHVTRVLAAAGHSITTGRRVALD